jgi:hypothetical protein
VPDARLLLTGVELAALNENISHKKSNYVSCEASQNYPLVEMSGEGVQ